jgi:hypothetical protein
MQIHHLELLVVDIQTIGVHHIGAQVLQDTNKLMIMSYGKVITVMMVFPPLGVSGVHGLLVVKMVGQHHQVSVMLVCLMFMDVWIMVYRVHKTLLE